MAAYPEIAGTPSPVFGEAFPYPFDGKQVMFEFANQFANEYNQRVLQYLNEIGEDRAREWIKMTVTSAYPTIRANCPRIAIIRTSSSPKLVGLGAEIETRKIELPSGEKKFRVYRGQTVRDMIDVSICCINERMRDDLFIWFQQYMLDAIGWALPDLVAMGGLTDMQCVNAVDDQMEYQGTQAQPGFEFYIGKLTFSVQYELHVLTDIDELKQIVNWQQAVQYADYS